MVTPSVRRDTIIDMRVVFMGSPEFALPTLSALIEHHNVVGVCTQPDRPAGRGRRPTPPPVKQLAVEHDLPLAQPESLKSDSALTTLRDWKSDVIVVAAYGQILPPSVLDLPPLGCINVHASLLPRWRGAAPVQAAILSGDEATGVTIMKMDPGLDTGPILAQESTPIQSDDTGGELAQRLAQLGADLLIRTLPQYAAGEIEPQPQDDSLATKAPLLRKRDGLLDFQEPAPKLERKIRAYHPWPGTHFYWQDQRIAVHQASVHEHQDHLPAGTAFEIGGTPAVETGSDALILEQIQPAGKRSMSGRSFLNGAQDFPGSRLLINPDE